MGQFENFAMIILSAAIVALPSAIAQQQYLLLLAKLRLKPTRDEAVIESNR
jgi:hypothetical protein